MFMIIKCNNSILICLFYSEVRPYINLWYDCIIIVSNAPLSDNKGRVQYYQKKKPLKKTTCKLYSKMLLIFINNLVSLPGGHFLQHISTERVIYNIIILPKSWKMVCLNHTGELANSLSSTFLIFEWKIFILKRWV